MSSNFRYQPYVAVDLRLGFETETCQGSCLGNLQYQRNKKRKTNRRQEQKRKKRRRMFLPMLNCRSTINKFTTPMDCMRTNLIFPTTSRELSLNTREFCTARGTTTKNLLMKLWRRLCLNLFSQGE